jgi:hypothetical protein
MKCYDLVVRYKSISPIQKMMKARIDNDCINYIYEVIAGNHKRYEIGGIILGLKTSMEIIAIEMVEI